MRLLPDTRLALFMADRGKKCVRFENRGILDIGLAVARATMPYHAHNKGRADFTYSAGMAFANSFHWLVLRHAVETDAMHRWPPPVGDSL